MADSRLRWDWTKAVVERGPPSSTTRHVLLTLALHMDGSGDNCRPSSTLLAEETRLTGRAVRDHLIRAEREGWIRRKKRGRVYLYTPTFPPSPEDQTPEGGSGVEDHKPRKEVPGSEPQNPERGSGVEASGPTETPEGGSRVTTPEGGSTLERGSGQPRKEVPVHRGRQGGSRQEEAPTTSPVTNTLPPSGTSDGERREVGSNQEAHPATDELWTADVRQAVVDVWHQGSERIEIHGTDRGLGAEYLAASDVLKATDGDVELVRWLIVEAPSAMGWDSEPRSLRWLAQGPNLEEAIAEYHRRDSGRNAQTAGVEIREAPERKAPDSERHRELRAQVEEARARLEAG